MTETLTAAADIGPQPVSTRDLRTELARGAVTMLPLLLGYLPFALLIGVAAGRSGDPVAAWSGSLLIFAGSAHLAVVELVASGASLLTAVTTALLINARLTVYSTSMTSLWSGAPLRHRLVAAAVVIDPMWLVADRRRQRGGPLALQRAYYAGAAIMLATGWSATVGLGAFIVTRPEIVAALAICTPLCLAAVVGPHVRTSAGLRCVVAAGLVATLTSSWPSGSGIAASMVAGAVAGTSRSGSGS